MEKYFTIRKLAIFCAVILFFFGVASCERSEEISLEKSNVGVPETERLFQEADVLRVERSKDPIEIVLKDMSGKEKRLSEFRGKIIFLNFWATWCVPCRREMPSMERLYNRFKDDDFVMIGINIQEEAVFVREFFEDYKLTFISLIDSTGDVRMRFGIRVIPSTFILDKTGRIIGKAIGEKEWDRKETIDLFEHLLGAKTEA